MDSGNGSDSSGGSRKGRNSRRTSDDGSQYSVSRPYSGYRDDVSVGAGSVSNAPVWSNHSRTQEAADTFLDEDQFSFTPVAPDPSANTIVGTFRPSLEDMVDVNVSRHGMTHGMSFNDKRNQPDHKVRRSSIFSMGGFDDTPFETVGMTNRKLFTWCCLLIVVVIVIVLAVTLPPASSDPSSSSDSSENGNSNSAAPYMPSVPTHSSDHAEYLDPTVSEGDCDFTNILQPDIFLQCRCHGHISVFSESSLVNYNRLKKDFLGKDILPRYHSKLDSCEPPNRALVWLASDNYPVEGDMRDRYMLALLFAAWKGAGWTNQEKWLLSSQSHCDWYGVECNGANRTVDLLLNDNNLVGEIPTEIVKLDSLVTLEIADNHLDGRIPRKFGEWTSIQRLELSGNSLIFSIPTELGIMENLQSLELDHNKLKGTIPTEIMRLPKLGYVGLFANSLTGTIPTEVGLLKNCREFKVYSNSLTGSIPTHVGEMEELKVWESGRNTCEGTIPLQFGNIGTLKTLDLSSMGLTGSIPAHFGNLATLETLNLADNYIDGKIPTPLGDMTMMASLYLNHNALSGSIPSQLAQLRELTKLKLQENNLTGAIPKELASCDKLESVNMSGNKFSGNVPDEVCSLRSSELKSMISDCRDDTHVICSVPDCCTECAP
mmetsp:Transcript_7728/g.12801  ORF Transcript_7728/g.12801 Transcript_7728/m.12801 type:complete len:658 (-) Transcript_7728:107-2080(-)|eukprot:CAMPEP_0119003178 /NCGR_PEP_ID=MMETSP1176-20130426/399_1 /TAXON_ID=265551 /ORGANISM="Synedropsis recta cf, Strain CCMP1620" /LENGTH=657 /DNA_ID=CAMNT_0006954751 /DNA_START=87 /DNA_END=2060 /DNA_ORIENTATION=-